MDRDDLHWNIFDNNPITEKLYAEAGLSWFFPVIGKRKSDTVRYSNGTGFFVNSFGYFVTAGHILKNIDLEYFAIIDNEELPFEILYIEYLDVESQDGIICKDLAICKLELQSNYQILQSDEGSNKIVSVSGFKREHQGRIAINPIKQGGLYLHRYSFEKELEINIEPPFNIDNRYKCVNTKTLKIIEGIKYEGLSGGPVYTGKNTHGLFISREYIISSYIISKLTELGIKCNT